MNRSTLTLGAAAVLLGLLVLVVVRSESSAGRAPIAVLPEPAATGVFAASSASEPVALIQPDERTSDARAADSLRPDPRATAKSPTDDAAPLTRSVAFLRTLLPDRFGALTEDDARALTALDLGGAHLRDGDLAHLAALPALDSISLRGSDVTDAGLADLRAVAKLKSVDLRNTKTTDLGVLALPTDRLEALHLTDSGVNAQDLRWLPAMPKLAVFKLNGLKLSDESLASLEFLPALRHLELDRTAITDDGLRRLLERNPSVQRVELRDTPVTPAAIAELAQSHPGVELVDGRDLVLIPR